MKTIITKIVLLLTIFSFFWLNLVWNTYSVIKVTVTEKIPGVKCDPDPAWYVWIYVCKVKPGFGTIVDMMGAIIKYFTFIAVLWGVLFIVYNGIMYSMGWMEWSLKDDAKKRIIQTLIWLLVLFLSWVILNLVAPWIYVA